MKIAPKKNTNNGEKKLLKFEQNKHKKVENSILFGGKFIMLFKNKITENILHNFIYRIYKIDIRDACKTCKLLHYINDDMMQIEMKLKRDLQKDVIDLIYTRYKIPIKNVSSNTFIQKYIKGHIIELFTIFRPGKHGAKMASYEMLISEYNGNTYIYFK